MSHRHFTFHFTLKDRAGRLLDTSRGGEPTGCVEGRGQIIEGLEAALVTMAVGERRAVVVPPALGYGEPEAELVQKVPRAHLPVGEIKAGDRFQTGPDRHAPVVTVVAVEGAEVLLDANHPLAGQELFFDVELVAVRAATAAELAGE
jgi:FKBP-type peptidyl-prolyl cis-trans isomerase SlyD